MFLCDTYAIYTSNNLLVYLCRDRILAAGVPVDPNIPKCEGPVMTPYCGETLSIGASSGFPESIEGALIRYGTQTPKAPAATVFDLNGKCAATITYGKLYTRAMKVAYALMNRLTPTAATVSVLPGAASGGDAVTLGHCVKPGDRVAIVVPNNDPITFLCAFYGCLLANVIPVPIEVPLTRRDAGVQAIGLLLSACGVNIALTSDKCFRSLPKCADSSPPPVPASAAPSSHSTSGTSSKVPPSSSIAHYHHAHHHSGNNVLAFKSWPVPLAWCVVENCSKLPRDWQPPALQQRSNGDASAGDAGVNSSCAYIEYTYDKNGAVIGVVVSRAGKGKLRIFN